MTAVWILNQLTNDKSQLIYLRHIMIITGEEKKSINNSNLRTKIPHFVEEYLTISVNAR